MEFNSDLAVLQSALHLADQQCSLISYEREQNPEPVMVVTDAVCEICTGLTHSLTEDETRIKQLQVAATIVAKILIGSDSDTNVNIQLLPSWLRHWNALIYGFPCISDTFMWEVFSAAGLWNQFFKLCPELSVPAATHLLTQLFEYLSQNTLDTEVLTVALGYISFHWASPLYIREDFNLVDETHNNQPNNQNVVDNISYHLTEEVILASFSNQINLEDSSQSDNLLQDTFDQSNSPTQEEIQSLVDSVKKAIAAFDFTKCSLTVQSSLFPSLCNMLCAFLDRKIWTFSELTPVDFKSPKLGTDQSPLNILAKLLKIDVTISAQIQLVCSEVAIEDLPIQVASLVEFELDLAPLISIIGNIVAKITQTSSVRMEDFFGNLNTTKPGIFLQNKHEIFYNLLWGKIYRFMTMRHQDCIQRVDLQRFSTKAELLNCLQQLVYMYHNKEKTDTIYWSQPDRKLSKAVLIVEHQLPGVRSELKWMLDVRDMKIIAHLSWKSCLMKKPELLCDDITLMAAIKQLNWIRNQDHAPQDLLLQLRKLLSDCFGNCDPEIQNSILAGLTEWFTSVDLERIFDVNICTEQALRTLLNQLTNDNFLKNISGLARICVQSPMKVVSSLLHTAVRNKGQINVLVQSMQRFPALMLYGRDRSDASHDCALVLALKQLVTGGQDFSEQEEKNLIVFCDQLLLPYSSGAGSEEMLPIMPYSQFLHNFILPHLANSAESLRNKHIVFSLLRSSVTTMTQLPPDWLRLFLNANPIMLLAVLLQEVNRISYHLECSQNFDTANSNRSPPGVRAEWLNCLREVVDILEQHPKSLSVPSVQWLLHVVKSVAWQTQWYCYKLLSYVLGENNVNLIIPGPLSELLPNVKAKTMSSSDDGSLCLLQFVCISDDTLIIVLADWEKTSHLTHPHLVMALAMILDSVTVCEMSRIMTFIRHWSIECVTLPASCMDLSPAVVSHQILDLATQLFARTSGGQNKDLLGHIAAKVAQTIKMSVLDHTKEIEDLCQSFLVLCNTLSYWPEPDSGQYLITLGLDMVSQMETLLRKPNIQPIRNQDRFISKQKQLLEYLIEQCHRVNSVALTEALSKVLNSTQNT